MAKVERNSLLYGVSGKLGDSILVSTSKGTYIRKAAKKKKVAGSKKTETAQAKKFRWAVAFVQNAQQIFRLGLAANWYYMGMRHVLNCAVLEAEGRFTMDYSRLRLTEGKLYIPLHASLNIVDGVFYFSWENTGPKKTCDLEAVFAVYYPKSGKWNGAWVNGYELKGQLNVLDLEDEVNAECFLFFRERGGKKSTNTFYLGSHSIS